MIRSCSSSAPLLAALALLGLGPSAPAPSQNGNPEISIREELQVPSAPATAEEPEAAAFGRRELLR
ncbi:MAG: hypothetical protein JW951_01085, partial [Lentisphaerae bacterium]|nr:hypothetical protein [Lentisphaerota bacterium]